MSSIKPSRRWQPAFYPFKKEKFGRRLLGKTELFVKGPLFGCRMCGNCLLQETAFICPMECPKGMRNGPCGGVNLPDNVLSRMEKAREGAPEEGTQIALELIESIKNKKGVNGIHIMSLGWESVIQRIVADSGLLRK